MSTILPGAAGSLAEQHPDLWSAYSVLGKACAETGPLSDRERRLVKLALAVGAASAGAVHSHSRRARRRNREGSHSASGPACNRSTWLATRGCGENLD